MSTLKPSEVNKFPEDSLESLCYNVAEKYSEYLPIANDRNRLGFNLYRYVTGIGDAPSILVSSIKLKIEGISKEELADKLDNDLKEIKK